MNDAKFLFWLFQRLQLIHGEPPNIDYMLKLRSIIESTPSDQYTVNLPKLDIVELQKKFKG